MIMSNYWTIERTRNALGTTGPGVTYNSNTGVFESFVKFDPTLEMIKNPSAENEIKYTSSTVFFYSVNNYGTFYNGTNIIPWTFQVSNFAEDSPTLTNYVFQPSNLFSSIEIVQPGTYKIWATLTFFELLTPTDYFVWGFKEVGSSDFIMTNVGRRGPLVLDFEFEVPGVFPFPQYEFAVGSSTGALAQARWVKGFVDFPNEPFWGAFGYISKIKT